MAIPFCYYNEEEIEYTQKLFNVQLWLNNAAIPKIDNTLIYKLKQKIDTFEYFNEEELPEVLLLMGVYIENFAGIDFFHVADTLNIKYLMFKTLYIHSKSINYNFESLHEIIRDYMRTSFAELPKKVKNRDESFLLNKICCQ